MGHIGGNRFWMDYLYRCRPIGSRHVAGSFVDSSPPFRSLVANSERTMILGFLLGVVSTVAFLVWWGTSNNLFTLKEIWEGIEKRRKT